MTDWTAVVPLKLYQTGKSRLSSVLDIEQRRALAEAMAQHVLGVLGDVSSISRVVLLSSRRPVWWTGDWSQDNSDDLNQALTVWRNTHGSGALLVIHADLPFLADTDVLQLLEAASEAGLAMATDRDCSGTNAIAIAAGSTVQFCFGYGSRQAHEAQRAMKVIQADGLARDIDSPADLAELRGTGFDRAGKTVRPDQSIVPMTVPTS